MSSTNKTYILNKDCPNIGKEKGDYYSNEYSDSIEELLAKGIIQEFMQEEVSDMSSLDKAIEETKTQLQRQHKQNSINDLSPKEKQIYEMLDVFVDQLGENGVDISYFPYEAQMCMIEQAKRIVKYCIQPYNLN